MKQEPVVIQPGKKTAKEVFDALKQQPAFQKLMKGLASK